MKATATDQHRAEDFIEYLEGLLEKGDRGALATLRRGLGKQPGDELEIYRYISRFIAGHGKQKETAYYLIATLFGLYPCESWQIGQDRFKTNLGASFRLLKNQNSGDSIERRFTGLINAHSDDLHNHLRQIVGLFKSKEIPVDWLQLLHAIECWDIGDERRVQREWAKAFWQEDQF
jgi:CRISPR system Cascade subunit CasB